MEHLTNDIDRIFKQLDLWRGFPNYQLERRADIFFALYLNKILKIHNELKEFNFDVVIPEFPLLKHTLRLVGESEAMALLDTAAKVKRHSVKADYLCIDTKAKKAVLVELKTDENSSKYAQLKNMIDAAEVTLVQLFKDLVLIRNASKSWKKYDTLLGALGTQFVAAEDQGKNAKWIVSDEVKGYGKPSLLVIKPKKEFKKSRKHPDIKLNVVCFDEISVRLKDEPGPLAQQMSEALKHWAE